MRRFLIYRLVRAAVVLWGVTTVVFVVARLSGDPVTLLVPLDTLHQPVYSFALHRSIQWKPSANSMVDFRRDNLSFGS
jgi:ABC-type dipeptide/oligopeptide/nickel transport system permease component